MKVRVGGSRNWHGHSWKRHWAIVHARALALAALVCLLAGCESSPGACAQTERLLQIVDGIGAQKPDAAAPVSTAAVLSRVARCTQPRAAGAYPEIPTTGRRREFFSKHPLATVLNKGGPTLRSPRVVGVFFDGDLLRAQTDVFLDSYGCTPEWRDAVGEYGIGDLLRSRAVTLKKPPPVATTTDKRAFNRWVEERFRAQDFGELSPEDILLFFIPAAYDDGTQRACENDEGGHDSVAGIPFGYVRTCGFPADSRAALNRRTSVGSRTLMKVAMNPFPASAPAWSTIAKGMNVMSIVLSEDYDDIAVSAAPSTEANREGPDLCAATVSSWTEARWLAAHSKPSENYPFRTARNYSNRHAVAGWNPCLADRRIDRCVAVMDGAGHRFESARQETDSDIQLEAFAEDPKAGFWVFVGRRTWHRSTTWLGGLSTRASWTPKLFMRDASTVFTTTRRSYGDEERLTRCVRAALVVLARGPASESELLEPSPSMDGDLEIGVPMASPEC
jgi:hypothetical protein